MHRETALDVLEQNVPAGWLVAGTSRLVDVWTPTPVLMRVPALRYAAHSMIVTCADRTQPEQGLLRRVRTAFRRPYRPLDSEIIFDARFDTQANVAHLLQNQIGPALMALESLGLRDRVSDLVMIVRPDAPRFAFAMAECFGVRLATSGPGQVSGFVVRVDPPKKKLYRPVVCSALRRRLIETKVLSDCDPPSPPLYLSRRGRRSLTNEAEISRLLEREAGAERVFAEDLSMEQQIRRIATAPEIIALHGAAIGFTFLRAPAQHKQIVEVTPCGFATNWARSIAASTNAQWMGVMGDLDGRAITRLQRGAHAHANEAGSYRLDPVALREAIRRSRRTPDDQTRDSRVDIRWDSETQRGVGTYDIGLNDAGHAS